MSRLIDADLLEEILDVNIQKLQDEIDDARTEVQKVVYEAQEFSTMEMIRVIKEQPTAFDVDKVVEQLEEEAFDMWICEEQFDMNSPYFKDVLYKVVKLCEAIDVVKAGGLDES